MEMASGGVREGGNARVGGWVARKGHGIDGNAGHLKRLYRVDAHDGVEPCWGAADA